MAKSSLRETLFPKKPMDPNSAEWWTYWSDMLKIAGISVGVIVTIIAFIGWGFSMKATKLKDEASKKKAAEFEQYKLDAGKAIAEADAKAAEANAQAAEANKTAALANERAASSELELQRLKDKIAPRRFSKPQIVALIEVLEKFPRRPHLVVWYGQPDKEAADFANHIADIVTAAGFKEGKHNGMWGRQIPPGLTLNSAHPDQDLVKLFAEAFKAAGVDLPAQSFEAIRKVGPSATFKQSDESPILVIGVKP